MTSHEPTRQQSLAQQDHILDLLWRVRESARIWRDLLTDEASRTALAHIQHAADVLIERAQLLTCPPLPPGPPRDFFL